MAEAAIASQLREAQFIKKRSNERGEDLGNKQSVLNNEPVQTPDTRSLLVSQKNTVRFLQNKQQAVKKAEQTSQVKHVERDRINDWISRSIVTEWFSSGIIEFITILIWLNIQLIWGGLVSKGTSKWISPLSWRFAKIPDIVPAKTLVATVLFIDFLFFLMVVPTIITFIIIIALVVQAKESTWEAIKMSWSNLGPLTDIIKAGIGL